MTKPPGSSGARAVLDRAEHDFGVVAQRSEMRTEFRLNNRGTVPLRVKDVGGGCSCIRAAAEAKEIAPGGSTRIVAAFLTQTFVGRHEKHFTVLTDDPAAERLPIRLVVDVSAGVVVEPANFFWPMARAGTSPEPRVVVKWKEGAGKAFRVTSVTPEGVDATFDVSEWDKPPWKGWLVTMRFRSPPPPGTVSARAFIATDDPQVPRITALVGGVVSGPVWLPQRQVSMGSIPAGKGATARVPVQPFDKTVDLGEVTAKATKGRVTATAERATDSPGAWIVLVRLPADAPVGPVEDVVEVKTPAAGGERLTIEVGGMVVAAPK